MTIDHECLYIGGEWTAAADRGEIHVASPTTEEQIGSVPEATTHDVDAAVAAARRALVDWASRDAVDRARVLARFADELDARADEMAHRVSSQNGMPISIARQFEGQFPAVLLRYFADLATNPTEDVRPGMLGGHTLVTREPIGVVAAIVPWNVPQAITFMKVAPALAAGCPVVIKPSPETVLDAFLMAEAATAAGLPAGLVNVVPGGRELGAYLVSHPGVDKVAFTGSTAAGREVGRACGELLRPVTLELGGKSAAIVLDDADLATSIEQFFAATLLNNGQICWLGTRVLVPRSRRTEIVDILADLARGLSVGDPLDDTTQLGPMVSSRHRGRVENYIERGRADGGRIVTGGGRPEGITAGWFVEPTIVDGVEPDHTIAREEIFGPVLAVISYDDDADAIAIANHSEYGLAGSVWTSDPDRGEQIARRVESGTIGINGYMNDPTAPFGGIKSSGIGTELGPEGLASYQRTKSIYLDSSSAR